MEFRGDKQCRPALKFQKSIARVKDEDKLAAVQLLSQRQQWVSSGLRTKSLAKSLPKKAQAIIGRVNRSTVSPNGQKFLVAIFSGQVESETRYCCILRGPLTNRSVCFYWNCASPVRPSSALRDDLPRSSVRRCVLGFIGRTLLGAPFLGRTQKVAFHFQIQE